MLEASRGLGSLLVSKNAPPTIVGFGGMVNFATAGSSRDRFG
jgi:hypothetical protein